MLGFLHKFPYSNFHEMNLDWIISVVKALHASFEALKKETDEAIEYMTIHLNDSVADIINQMIAAGDIHVGVTYDADNERIDIIVTQ